MVRWSESRDMNNFLKINRQNLLIVSELIVFLIGIVSRLTVMKQGLIFYKNILHRGTYIQDGGASGC